MSEVISGFWEVAALATPILRLTSEFTWLGKVGLEKDTTSKQEKFAKCELKSSCYFFDRDGSF